MKNIVLLTGSPRKNGNTDILAEAFAEGARSAGNRVVVLNASEKRINGCIGCNSCYRNADHSCAFRDDMTDCYDILAQADVIVAATPIYFYGVSSQLKSLIDRLHNPIRGRFKVKTLGLLCVCADKNESVFSSVITMYKSILSYFSLEDGGIVTVSGVSEKGDINGRPELEQARKMGEGI